MRFSRSTYLHLADTSVPLFTTLRRRDQVPRVSNKVLLELPTEAQEDASGYLPIEAVLLALANDFCAGGGLDPHLAARLVGGYPNLLIPAVRRAEGGEDIWFAQAAFREEDSDAEFLGLCEVGTMPEILAALQAFAYSDGFRPWPHIHRLAAVSVSRAVRQVRARAEKSGLALGAIA